MNGFTIITFIFDLLLCCELIIFGNSELEGFYLNPILSCMLFYHLSFLLSAIRINRRVWALRCIKSGENGDMSRSKQRDTP